MTNARIVEVLEQLADLLELQGENAFRVRAYRNAARAIGALAEDVADILADPARKLTDIDGVGDSVADKCAVLVHTGDLPQLRELLAKTPQSVLALLRVPGVGPKKAAALHKELGVRTLEELRAACEQGRVQDLKGFGAKTQAAILQGLQIAEAAGKRLLWADADRAAQALRAHLAAAAPVERLEFAGSYRRGKDTVGDLDILVVSSRPNEVMDRFGAFPDGGQVLARGDTKMSLRLGDQFQVDLRVVPPQSFGAALQYFTGSKEHNVALRRLAKQRGLKINEYGVFRVEGENETYVAGENEADVYAALGLPPIPPELRENRGELAWAEQGQLPKLLELADLRGDLHMHTTDTDGQHSLAEMAAAAGALGREYIAITDHSQRMKMVRGLDPQRLLEQWRRVDEFNARAHGGPRVLKGIECDILEAGGLDLPDEVLAQADWVVASVHFGQKQSREQITGRVVGALRNKHVCVVAHPTGRLLNQREAYPLDFDEVLRVARQEGKFLELNSHPQRLDLDDVHCAAAKSAGVPIVISTDAHSAEQLTLLRYGVPQARRAALTAGDVVNTRPWPEVLKLLGRA